MNKKEFLKMEKEVKEAFYCPYPPYPICGIVPKNSIVKITLGNYSITDKANEDGEFVIDLTEFWFRFRVNYVEYKTIKIEYEERIDLDKGMIRIKTK